MAQEDVPIQLWQEVFRNILQEPVAILLLFAATVYWIYYTIKTYQKKGLSRAIYLGTINFFIVVVAPAMFIIVTEAIALQAVQYGWDSFINVERLRWLGLYIFLCPLATIITYEYSRFKSGIAMFGHLTILLLGWLFGKWPGIFFISLPLIGIFYFYLFHYAQVIYPASDPEDKTEQKNKFLAIIWYIWGAQYPIWVAESSATRKINKIVDGDYFKGFGGPGITWMHSHQVFGQSSGIEFEKADGPGIAFVDQYVRPIAVVDLRTQLRPTPFEAITKDGIEITAVVFISFKIDEDDWSDWDKQTRHRVWRTSPILHDGLKPDKNLDGIYPYSAARIHAVLSTIGVGAPEEDDETPDIYWDEIVVERVVKEARHVIAEYAFDELWTPRDDERGKSALDKMATDIMERAVPRLQEIGIKLFTARIVNYIVEENSKLREQMISTWLSSWKQKINSLEIDGITEAERLRTQARSSARAVFLASISESLARARKVDDDLPKQVVALNFLAALESLLDSTSTEEAEKQAEKLEILRLLISSN